MTASGQPARDAFAALQEGDIVVARERADAGIAVNPADPDLWLILGLVQIRTGKYAEAEHAIRNAITLASDTKPRWQEHLATAVQAQGRYREADSILAHLPQAPRIQRKRSLCMESVGELAGAIRLLEEVVAGPGRLPGDLTRLASLRLQVGEARLALTVLATQDPSLAGSHLFWRVRGLACLQDSDCGDARAREYLTRALSIFPGDRASVYGLIGIARRAGRLDEAREIAESFASLDQRFEQLEALEMRYRMEPANLGSRNKWVEMLENMSHPDAAEQRRLLDQLIVDGDHS